MNDFQKDNIARIIKEVSDKYGDTIWIRGELEYTDHFVIKINDIGSDLLAQLNLKLISWQMMNTSKLCKPVYAEVDVDEN